MVQRVLPSLPNRGAKGSRAQLDSVQFTRRDAGGHDNVLLVRSGRPIVGEDEEVSAVDA